MARAIVAYLKATFPRVVTPATLAREVREAESTVRKELHRLAKKGHVVNVDGAGWYRAFADPALLSLAEKPEPSLHAMQVRTVWTPLQGGLGVPRGGQQAVLSGATRRGWVADPSNGQAFLRDRVRGRAVSLQASPSGVVLLNVSATMDPVRFSEWAEFAAELRGWCKAHGIDLDAPVSELVNVEFNVDWRAYFLGEVKRMKLSSVGPAWAQIYQKHRDALRMELRVPPTGLTFKEAVQNIVFLAEARAPLLSPPKPADPNDPGVV